MNRSIDELLSTAPEAVYIGEDVEHGGYYLVTEGLKKRYGFRVADFPPDETSLIGIGMGYSQGGLLPVVEIPYAKYLDCGYDMFEEAGIMNWLSNGQQPNGMLVRLQGFGRGVFGGNFHTHNTLHIPPGIDVVCYSNGYDYARGFRHAMKQAKAGRVVMSVDSTHLLNLRHLHPQDGKWISPYPEDVNDIMSFDEVRIYTNKTTSPSGDFGVSSATDAETLMQRKKIGIISYGDGVLEALLAKAEICKMMGMSESDIDVIDSPYLSQPSAGLRAAVRQYDSIVFADICKEGQAPLEGMIPRLQNEGLLPAGGRWRSVAAARAYNPLSSSVTFTNYQDIVSALLSMHLKR